MGSPGASKFSNLTPQASSAAVTMLIEVSSYVVKKLPLLILLLTTILTGSPSLLILTFTKIFSPSEASRLPELFYIV
jgi:hypothetical protein